MDSPQAILAAVGALKTPAFNDWLTRSMGTCPRWRHCMEKIKTRDIANYVHLFIIHTAFKLQAQEAEATTADIQAAAALDAAHEEIAQLRAKAEEAP